MAEAQVQRTKQEQRRERGGGALGEGSRQRLLADRPVTERRLLLADRAHRPTTLIWGCHARATPLAVAEEASARFGWPRHVIENCNDDPPVEQPEALLRTLRVAFDGV